MILAFNVNAQQRPVGAGQNQGNQAGQEADEEPIRKKREKVVLPKGAFIPSAVRVGGDVGALIANSAFKTTNRYEMQADIDFYRFYLVGEYGVGNYTTSTDLINYSNSGRFYRVGFDIDFLKFDTDYNIAYIGFRFAQATFSDEFSYLYQNPIYGDSEFSGTNQSATANWREIVAGMKGQIYGNIYMGYAFRFMINRELQSGLNYRPYQIPGFGIAQFNSRWSFHYYVYYRLAFREKAVPVKKRK